ncbi:alpha-ketoglutarate-dependent dioxygenase AlkB [Flavobacterium sp. DG1-102-2]|uniref:alpha-ketoglutarate-dependent dioxygenase AlkB family protein n=1 Tax=Flavobacterium sp. DG1-102-2 TaxID=3081663 RepID=UPI002948EC64|nr:alpha-ketoglutarate-dependent dioxygenase AlkB [Flavobacterium sp. DG1-102-2]MDV6168247.1 alpha-ketoglutarate-dependent dioxygenase AlkB [Flavobacterium sp. DG1-102-2]
MNLFNDTDIFTSGKPEKTVFDVPDADLMLYEGFFAKEESDAYYNTLLVSTNWKEADLTVYDKTHIIPRMIAWYEDKSNPGANQNGQDWTPELSAIKKRVEAETNFTFNSVLLNLYRNGKDGVGWHSDRTENFGQNQVIASVSFGETRPFRLRHKARKDLSMLEVPLTHGALFLMAGTTQTHWEHHIPKTAKDILPRINLTFRQVKRQL